MQTDGSWLHVTSRAGYGNRFVNQKDNLDFKSVICKHKEQNTLVYSLVSDELQ